MYCLWNGEYGEHDLRDVPGLSENLRQQEKAYARYIGTTVGDFTCLEVEYDWGRHDQRWKVQCNRCGEVSFRYHTNDWRRGKGQRTTCHCGDEERKNQKEQLRQARKIEQLKETQKRQEQETQKRQEQIEAAKKEYIGKTYETWKIIDHSGFTMCEIQCQVCGRTRKRIKTDELLNGKILACTHRAPTDFSGDEWIGRRSGNLTVLARKGNRFVAECDCGEIIEVFPSQLFTKKEITTCRSPFCLYIPDSASRARLNQAHGFTGEQIAAKVLRSKGFTVEITRFSNDFGVDLIAEREDIGRIAVQCKQNKGHTGVDAIQQVYAGGRYYDCERFAVIAKSDFSDAAIRFASKLGVYLCSDLNHFEYPADLLNYTENLLPVFRSKEKLDKLYELNGEKHTLSDWAALYGKSYSFIRNLVVNRNVSLDIALNADPLDWQPKRKAYEVKGFKGTKKEVCEHYGVTAQFVDYRMKQYPLLTLEEAIFIPKGTNLDLYVRRKQLSS